MMNWFVCDVCEQNEWDVGEIELTRFDTWECKWCHEQSLRLEYGESKYPYGGGTKSNGSV
jgi:hypothetical protein